MLQRQHAQGALHAESEIDSAFPFTPSQLLEILKRRAFYFLIPFVLIAGAGSVVALAWPAQYLSKGKILVQSPEIPTDLVRPTVSTLANERMQIIQQRIMTRDNLLEIAKKFKLTTGWRGTLSGTEIVDFIRARTVLEPVDVSLLMNRRNNRQEQAIAFSVGFEYEDPATATKVANEFLTMILKADVNARTSFAAETTKFLERDVARIEDRLTKLDGQVLDAKVKARMAQAGLEDVETPGAPATPARQLAALKAQLAVKSATFSSSHPDIVALKRAIDTLEAEQAKITSEVSAAAKKDAENTGSGNTTLVKAAGDELGLDTLESKRETLKKELAVATQKLAQARLGESLERGQHSERLEVIEQPTLPDKPISPNRPKLFAVVFALAFMAGGGLLFVRETTDQSVRKPADVASIIDSHLVVSIPYIATQRENRRRGRKIIFWITFVIAVTAAAAVAAYIYLPTPDLWYDKAMDKMMKLLLR
jgi:uncharacterized protein involved in exopolysaccharide biosynthesis